MHIYIYTYIYVYIYIHVHIFEATALASESYLVTKKQLFRFGGLKCPLSKEDLLEISSRIIKDLEKGGGYEAAAQRAKQLVKNGIPSAY